MRPLVFSVLRVQNSTGEPSPCVTLVSVYPRLWEENIKQVPSLWEGLPRECCLLLLGRHL